jgi:hypothetical protein
LAFKNVNITVPDCAILSSLCFSNANVKEAMKYFIGLPGPIVLGCTKTKEDKTEDPLFVHPAKCSACSKRIFGIRYKCLSCADYDLCKKCRSYSRKHHLPFHPFVKLTSSNCGKIKDLKEELERAKARAEDAAKKEVQQAEAEAAAKKEKQQAEEMAKAEAKAREDRLEAAMQTLLPLGFDASLLKVIVEETNGDIDLTLEQLGLA